MRVGITGTREGLSYEQSEALKEALWALRATELHCGDCIGADAECDEFARQLGIKIVIHPSTFPSNRAWRSRVLPCEVMPERPPLARNRNIVRSVDFLLAAPSTEHEVLRSGTWAAIRYALKHNMTVFVIYPSGRIEEPGRGNDENNQISEG